MVEIPFSFVLRLHNSFGDKDNTGLNINPHGASAHTSRLAMMRKYGLDKPKMAQRKNEGAIIDFNGRKNTVQTKCSVLNKWTLSQSQRSKNLCLITMNQRKYCYYISM